MALYFSNSACQTCSDIGGSAPVTGFHSVIERPESVSRVSPPISTMTETMAARVVWLVATGQGPVLLVGAETLTRVVDPIDRTVRVLFGDGAGAVVLGADEHGSLGPFDLGSDGTDPSILWQEATGTRVFATPEVLEERRQYLTMRGTEVYRHAVVRMADSSRAVLDAAGLGVDDVDLFVGHQANRRILDAVAERLGMPAERCQVSVERHANTSAASIPLALSVGRRRGEIGEGDLIVTEAIGGGLAWGSVVLRW